MMTMTKQCQQSNVDVDEATLTMIATMVMVETVTAMVTTMVTAMAMMPPPLPMATMLMKMTAAVQGQLLDNGN
jgi:hypothetical protein